MDSYEKYSEFGPLLWRDTGMNDKPKIATWEDSMLNVRAELARRTAELAAAKAVITELGLELKALKETNG